VFSIKCQSSSDSSVVNFDKYDINHVRRIGEILIDPRDPDVDELFDQIGFKEIGKEIIKIKII